MSEGIAYQNKDILLKVLSQNYVNKSFKALAAYLELPKIIKMLPADLPKITASELRMDNIFLLEDDSILIVDYESTATKKNFIKYINYVAEVLRGYYNLDGKIYNIIVLIIYTGDITEAENTFKIDCMEFNVKQVYLSNLNSDEMYNALKHKIEAGEMLNDEEMTKLTVLPLTEPTKEKKQMLVEKTVDLAKKIADEKQQLFALAAILVASDKFIDDEYSNRIKEWISMTKVSKLFEEEKIEALNKAEEEKIEALKQKDYQFAKNLLKDGVELLAIMKYTKLTKNEILKIKSEMELSAVN